MFRSIMLLTCSFFLSYPIFPQDDINKLMSAYANSFWNSNDIIFVQGRLTNQFNQELNDIFLEWKNNSHIKVKYEDELDSLDLLKHLRFFGPIASYNNLHKFSPESLVLIQNGFKLGPFEFTDSLDAINIFSSDSARYFQLGNSLTGVQSLWTTFPDVSQYFIMQNFAITHHGFLNNDQFDSANHFDTQRLRTEQLKRFSTDHYDFFYDKSVFSNRDNIDSLFSSEDLKFKNVLEFFNLEMPERKISCYIYKDLEQKYYLSATPGYGNPFPFAWENHSIGFGPVEHETIHILFDNIVGINSTFFSEGIVGYYYSTKESLEWKRTKMMVSKMPDFSIKPYLLNTVGFNFSQLDYAASAHFVKFLVDTYGLEKFKSFSITGDIERGFNNTYKKDISEITTEWEDYFRKNKIQLGPEKQITIKVITNNFTDSSSIYITGDNEQFGRWNPSVIALEKQNDGSWIKSFSFPEGSIFYYKITRGSWEKEALDEKGNVPPNSVYEVKDDSTLTIRINDWKDLLKK